MADLRYGAERWRNTTTLRDGEAMVKDGDDILGRESIERLE